MGSIEDLEENNESSAVNVEGEGDESEEGEDIGDLLDELAIAPITTVAHGEASEDEDEEEEGEDIGDILEDLVAKPITPILAAPVEDDRAPSPEPKKEIKSEESQSSNESNESDVRVMQPIEVPTEAIGAITKSFIESYKGPLEKMHETLREFSRSQEKILRYITEENERMSQLPPELISAAALFEKAPLYQTKIENLHREMASLTERVQRAKSRSTKLCQKKRQDDKEEAIKLQKLKEKEELLTAKPAENLFYDW